MNDLSDDDSHRGRIRELAETLQAWQKRVNDPFADRPVLV